jgi:hypothetical protein
MSELTDKLGTTWTLKPSITPKGRYLHITWRRAATLNNDAGGYANIILHNEQVEEFFADFQDAMTWLQHGTPA